MLTKQQRLEQELAKLSELNRHLEQLLTRTGAYSSYTIAYANAFLKAKKSEDFGKKPSDELAKQIALADPELQPYIEAYNDVKFGLEIVVQLSRNQSRIIDNISTVINEEQSVNAHL